MAVIFGWGCDHSPVCSGLGEDLPVPGDATKAAEGQVLSLETNCELMLRV